MTLPTLERQAEFLATIQNVTVATIRPDGLPQLTPNWFLWTGSSFLISTAASTVKIRNLRRDPRIVLCVDDVASGDYVQVTGTATLIEGEEAVREPTLDICRKYMAEDTLEAHWQSLLATGPQVIIEVRPDRFQWHDRV
jgi:PPOX class probable F420-dependent enzyme